MAPSNPFSRILGATAFRITAAAVAVFLGASILVLGFLFARTNSLVTAQVVESLRSEAAVLGRDAAAGGLDGLKHAVTARSRDGGAALYLLTDRAGRVLAGNLDHMPPELTGREAGGVFRYPGRTPGAGERLAVALFADVPGGRLLVARDLEQQRAFAAGMRNIFLLSFGALSLAALAAGYAASRLALRRIEAMNATARSIMEGELSRRVPVSGAKDELDGLAENFNRMLDRIEQLMAGLREVSDNIAHDLKTPLTRLRARLEEALREPGGAEAYREGLEHALEESDDLIKTFNALLLIARLEAGAFEESTEAFDLGELVRGAAELYEPVAEQAGLDLPVEASRGVCVVANRQLVSQAVANLIDNAIKYSRVEPGKAGGARGAVAVGLTRRGDSIELIVADSGPGIAPADRERAVKRFVRLESSRTPPGTGLGLSLVAAVARLHGGRLRLEDNEPGLRAVLELPARLIVK